MRKSLQEGTSFFLLWEIAYYDIVRKHRCGEEEEKFHGAKEHYGI